MTMLMTIMTTMKGGDANIVPVDLVVSCKNKDVDEFEYGTVWDDDDDDDFRNAIVDAGCDNDCVDSCGVNDGLVVVLMILVLTALQASQSLNHPAGRSRLWYFQNKVKHDSSHDGVTLKRAVWKYGDVLQIWAVWLSCVQAKRFGLGTISHR